MYYFLCKSSLITKSLTIRKRTAVFSVFLSQVSQILSNSFLHMPDAFTFHNCYTIISIFDCLICCGVAITHHCDITDSIFRKLPFPQLFRTVSLLFSRTSFVVYTTCMIAFPFFIFCWIFLSFPFCATFTFLTQDCYVQYLVCVHQHNCNDTQIWCKPSLLPSAISRNSKIPRLGCFHFSLNSVRHVISHQNGYFVNNNICIFTKSGNIHWFRYVHNTAPLFQSCASFSNTPRSQNRSSIYLERFVHLFWCPLFTFILAVSALYNQSTCQAPLFSFCQFQTLTGLTLPTTCFFEKELEYALRTIYGWSRILGHILRTICSITVSASLILNVIWINKINFIYIITITITVSVTSILIKYTKILFLFSIIIMAVNMIICIVIFYIIVIIITFKVISIRIDYIIIIYIISNITVYVTIYVTFLYN